MNTKEFLSDVCKEIKYKPASKTIYEEIETHIEDIKKEKLCEGFSEKKAEEEAVKQMGNAKEIGKRLNKIHRPKLDWKVLISILILIVFRIILYIEPCMKGQWEYSRFMGGELEKTIKYTLIGLGIAVILYFFDYRKTKKYINLIYLTSTGILFFQWINWYFSIDTTFTGNILNMRLWNICIPLYIISFAGYMNDYNKDDFFDMTILYTISCILIYAQSGSITNTGILILAYLTIIASHMLRNNKNSIKKVVITCSATMCIAILVMFLMSNIKSSFLFLGKTTEELYNGDIYEKTQNYEDEILRNLNWIGSTNAQEELSASNSSQFKFLYLVGRLGIIPATILVLIILFMSVTLINNSKNIKDTYGKYLMIGLSTTYIVQSIIHVLMNLNLWIRSDINLPFVTEGNLYFIINSFTFGIILSVYRRKDINFEEPKKSKLATKIE